MSIAWLFLTASLLLPSPSSEPAADVPACGVELHVRARSAVTEVQSGMLETWSTFEAVLVNSSDRPLTLVMPGDGSDNAWRTPVLRWSLSPAPQPTQLVRCGNINALRPNEVFTLAPGERQSLGQWVPPIYGVASGEYTLRLTYINDPTLEWQGVPLGPHDPSTMERVRKSTACSAVSNEVKITLVSKQTR